MWWIHSAVPFPLQCYVHSLLRINANIDVALSFTKPRFSCFPLALKYKQTVILLVKTELI